MNEGGDRISLASLNLVQAVPLAFRLNARHCDGLGNVNNGLTRMRPSVSVSGFLLSMLLNVQHKQRVKCEN